MATLRARLLFGLTACAAFGCSDGDGRDGSSSGSGSTGSGSSSSGSSGGSPAPRPSPGWAAAVGDRGTLLQTFDDVNWESREIANQDLNAVTCIGNLHGWVVGDAGLVLHTPDSGESFHQQLPETGEDLLAARFALGADGDEIGVVAGNRGALAVSSNSGNSWRNVDVGAEVTLRAVGITYAAQVIVVVGDGGLLLYSDDSGQTFVERQIEGAADLHGVAMDTLGGVTAVDSAGNVWQSGDWGNAFDLVFEAGVPLHSVDVAADGTWAVIAGAGGTVLTRNADAGFERATLGDAALRAALISVDGARGYVAGDGGVLLRTANRGRAWARVESPTAVTLRGLEDLDVY